MLSPTHLYETVMISSGGMTNRLDRLERTGLVERRPDPNDRRGKLIALTDAGKRVIDETIDRHVANEERILSVLTLAEQKKLNALLRKLIAGLQRRSTSVRQMRGNGGDCFQYLGFKGPSGCLIARRLAPQAWQASAQSHSARDRRLRKLTKGH
jgi:DNA-binding PadR family transcriptional regulator